VPKAVIISIDFYVLQSFGGRNRLFEIEMPSCRDRKRRLLKSRIKGGMSAAIVVRMMPEADDSDVLTRRSAEDFADAHEMPANA
jgi:hypothetical protein